MIIRIASGSTAPRLPFSFAINVSAWASPFN